MRVTSSIVILVASAFKSANAFTISTSTASPASCINNQIQKQSTTTQLLATNVGDKGDVSRSNFFQQIMVGTTTAAAAVIMNPTILPPAYAEDTEVKLPSGTSYVILKSGDGPKPKVGELAGIRFKAEVLQTGNKIDDVFDTSEPYYTRVGSGGLLKGVEEVLPTMRVGDRFLLTIPTSMAFGPKGRPSSAGKPRIPGDAIIIFEVEMVGLPGREQELIDIIGDD